MVYSGVNLIYNRKYTVFGDVLEGVVSLWKLKVDGKEDITL